ncbi:MAG: hypothetical protein GY861_19285, partial [bacterium]|nr:hypothetical protein [bacterium]
GGRCGGSTCCESLYVTSDCLCDGNTGSETQCDSSPSSGQTFSGICTENGGTDICTDSGDVCWTGTVFEEDLPSCSEGNACDASLTSANYVADGEVFNNDGTNICCDGAEDYEDTGGSQCCYNGAVEAEAWEGGTGNSLICSNGLFYDCGNNGGTTSPDADETVSVNSCTAREGQYCQDDYTWNALLPDDCAGCSDGGDCYSGLCVAGTCRDSCNGYTTTGAQCSDDSSNAYTADGICTYDGSSVYDCDETLSATSGANYFDDCAASGVSNGDTCDPNSLAGGYSQGGRCGGSTCCESLYVTGDCLCDGNTGSETQCDSSPSSGQTFSGICTENGGTDICTDSGDVCWTGTVFEEDIPSCSEGNACDASLTGADYVADGVVFTDDAGNLCCDGTEDYNQSSASGACCYNGAILADAANSSSILCEEGVLYDCGSQVDTSPDADHNDADCQARGSLYCDTDENTWITTIPTGCSGCSAGTDCEEGICVDGTCRSSCTSYVGYGCSANGVAYNHATTGGVCLLSGSCDQTDPVRMDCGGAGTSSCEVGTDATYSACNSTGGDSCDSETGGGNFAQAGLCADSSGSSCITSGFVIWDGAAYQASADPDAAAEGDSCDETLTNGDFNAGSYKYDPDDADCDDCSSYVGDDTNCEEACGANSNCDEDSPYSYSSSSGWCYSTDGCGSYCTSHVVDEDNDAAFSADSGESCGCGSNDVTQPKRCDTDFDQTSEGVCVDNDGDEAGTTYSCDGGEICDDGTNFADDCDDCTSGSACDSAVGTAYEQDGICVNDNSCDIDDVCFSGGDYYAAMSSCSEGDVCDGDVDPGYSTDGVVFDNDGSNLCCNAGEDYEHGAVSGACCYNATILADGSSNSSVLCEEGLMYDCGSQITASPDADTDDSDCQQRGSSYCDTDTNTWIATIPTDCSGCSDGNDCEAGICVEGTCRASCSGYVAEPNRCSDTSSAYDGTSGGLCVYNESVYYCDTDEVANESSIPQFVDDCALAAFKDQCDDDIGTGGVGYVIEGVCGGGGGVLHEICLTAWASDSDNDGNSPTIGTAASADTTVCSGANAYYCDYTGDGVWNASDTAGVDKFRCDASDSGDGIACVLCTAANAEGAHPQGGSNDNDGQCESGCGADATCDEQTVDACVDLASDSPTWTQSAVADEKCSASCAYSTCDATCCNSAAATATLEGSEACDGSKCAGTCNGATCEININDYYVDCDANAVCDSGICRQVSAASADSNACDTSTGAICDGNNEEDICVNTNECAADLTYNGNIAQNDYKAAESTDFDVDNDGDNDYCSGGAWYDCNTDSQCSYGYYCNGDNDCESANIIVNLTSPLNNTYVGDTVIFECVVSSNSTLDNVTLYHDYSGSWTMNATNTSASGTSHSQRFIEEGYTATTFVWNCQVCDTVGNCAFATVNRSVTVELTSPNVVYVSPTEANTSFVNRNWAFVNVSVSDTANTSAFVDFNRSLVGYWSFDYYNETHIHDNSTYENNGRFMSSTSTDNLTVGIRGKAMQLEKNEYVDCGNDASLNITTKLTVEAWAKATVDMESSHGIVSKRDGWRSKVSYSIYENWGTDTIVFQVSNNGTDFGTVNSNFHPVKDEWFHVVGVYDGSEMRFYIDGVLRGTTAYSGNIYNSSTPVLIGRHYASSSEYWNGSIDEVKVWNRVLSAEEINASFNAGLYNIEANFTGLPEESFNFTAYVVDAAGNVNKTETRSFTVDLTTPTINFTYPTIYNGSASNKNWAYVNVSTTDANDMSAIIDWNRSLVGYWSFDHTNSTHVHDNSTYGYGGSFENFVSTSTTAGIRGKAMEFDGSNDHIDCGTDSVLKSERTSSLSAWVYIDYSLSTSDMDDWARFVDVSNGAHSRYRPDTKVIEGLFRLVSAGNSFLYHTITESGWYHVVTSFNGTNGSLYVNGLLEDSFAVSSDSIDYQGTNTYIGGASANFKGRIDEVQIWNRVLSQEEINASYNAGVYRLERNFTSIPDGSYNFSANVIDAAGNMNKTDTRQIIVDTTSPSISFISPTEDNASAVNRDWAYVNASVSDANYVSSLVDFNRSLVGWWSFEDGSLSDASTHGNDLSNSGAVSTTDGKFGDAMEFGPTDWLSLSDNPSLNIEEMDGLTVETWVKLKDNTRDASSAQFRIAAQFNYPDAGWYLRYNGRSSAYFRFTTYTATSDINSYFSITNESLLNNWHHVVAVMNKTHNVIYLDGVQGDPAAITLLNDSTNDLEIGSSWTPGSWNGTIDEFKIWNRALSAKEINASFNAGVYRLERNFTGLNPGVYNYTAYAIDIAGNKNQTETRYLTVDIPVSAVSSFAANNKSGNISTHVWDTTTNELTWSNPSGALEGVLIVRSSDNSFGTPAYGTAYAVGDSLSGDTVIYNESSTSFNDTSLSAGTTYYYRAFAYNSLLNYSSGADVNGNTGWKPNQYYVQSTVTVPNSTTLTILPGVVVKYASGTEIYVRQGALNATGTSAHSDIIFTSMNDNSVGNTISGSSGTPAAGDYSNAVHIRAPRNSVSGINMTNVTMSYFTARYATRGIYNTNEGGYGAWSSTGEIKEGTLTQNEYGYVTGSNNNERNIYNMNLSNNTNIGYYHRGDDGGGIRNSTISYNGKLGIHMEWGQHYIENNTIEHNGGHGINITDPQCTYTHTYYIRYNTIRYNGDSVSDYGLNINLFCGESHGEPFLRYNNIYANGPDDTVGSNDNNIYASYENASDVLIMNLGAPESSNAGPNYWGTTDWTIISGSIDGNGTVYWDAYLTNEYPNLTNTSMPPKSPFNITLLSGAATSDTTPDISWTFNDTSQHFDSSNDTQTAFAVRICTSSSDCAGTMTTNGTGTTATQWTVSPALNQGTYYCSINTKDQWTVANWGIWSDASICEFQVDTSIPVLNFTSPTETDGDLVKRNWAYVNVSVSDVLNVSAFIDWNRSLVLWMRFDNASDLSDQSGYSNDGTNYGTAYAASGKFGGGRDINGSGARVDIADSVSISPNESITAEGWYKFRPTGSTYYQRFLDTSQIYILPRESNSVLWSVELQDCSYPIGPAYFNQTAALSPDVWYHLAVTYDYSTHYAYGYVNGEQVAQHEFTGCADYHLLVKDEPMTIGGTETGDTFNGTVDDVKLWRRALSPQEINASFNAGVYRLERNFTGLADGLYNFTAYATDAAGNVNSTETRNVTIQYQPIRSEFSTSNGSTDFSSEPDMTNVYNLTLANENGSIDFPGDYPVNAAGEDYDESVDIGNRYVAVNSSALDSTFNSSTNITLNNVTCDVAIYYADDIYSNALDIIKQNNWCNSTSNPSCGNITCTGSTVMFTASHFTSFAAVGDSNLTIWDETDMDGMPYAGQVKYPDEDIRFLANYTNSSGFVEGANCTINISGSINQANMSWNTTGFYQYNLSISSSGRFGWNVTCNLTDYETLATNDSVLINSTDIGSCQDLSIADTTYRLTQDVNSTGTCFNISASNVTLDCQGYLINYSRSSSGYAVVVFGDEYDYTTIKNCRMDEGSAQDFSDAISVKSGDYSLIENNTITTGRIGSDADFCVGIRVRDSNRFNISWNTITTQGSEDNYGIYLYNTSMSNVTGNVINTSFTDEYGTGVYLASNSSWNRIIKNTITTGYEDSSTTYENYGIYMVSSSTMLDNNLVKNNKITTRSRWSYGIFVYGQSSNILNYNNFSNNNITTFYGGAQGMRIVSVNNTVITNNYLITSGGNATGIFLSNSDNSLVVNNTIITFGENTYGLNLSDVVGSGIYNNYINTTALQVYILEPSPHNMWNTSQQAGGRIFSPGLEIGGNYYSNITGNGFSDTCTDVDADGICDDYYNLTTGTTCTVSTCGNNTDYLVLSNEFGADIYVPVLSFVDTIEVNNSAVSRDWAQLNMTITEENLDTFDFDWQYTGKDDYLVGWWKLDNNSDYGESNTLANDYSPAGKDMTITGGTYYRTGKRKMGLNFDGSADYASNDAFTALNSVSNFTISAWVWLDALPGDIGGIVAKKETGATNGVSVAVTAAGSFYGWVNNGGNTFKYTTGSTIETQKWYYLTMVYDGTQSTADNRVMLYVNGNLTSQTAAGTLPTVTSTNSEDLVIGCFPEFTSCPSAGDMTDGIIDEVRIYNTALAADEVKSRYQSARSRYYDHSLVLAYNFENRSSLGENSTLVKDISKYGNDGTAYGASWNSSGKYSAGFSFDGNYDYIHLGNDSSLGLGEELTLEMWIYPANIHTGDYFGLENGLVYHGNDSATNIGYGLQIDSATTIDFFKRNPEESITYFQYTVPNLLNKWSHLALVYKNDTTDAELFYNGLSVGNLTIPDGINAGDSGYYFATLGASCGGQCLAGSNNETYFNGTMDEVRIYSRALGADEIWHHYQSEFQKYNSTDWRFYSNLSNLTEGSYEFFGWANDTGSYEAQSVTRGVTIDTINPVIDYVSPTESTEYLARNWTYVNVTVDDASDSSAFIDFNRSLVGYWSFDYYNSTHILDNSTNENPCAFIYGLATDNLTSGKRGTALEFDGVDDYVNCGDDNIFNMTGELTVEAWIKYPQLPSTVDGNWEDWVGRTNPQVWALSTYGTTNAVNPFIDDATLTRHHIGTLVSGSDLLNWNHIVMTYNYDDGVQRGYVNGELIQESFWKEYIATNSSNLLFIGSRHPKLLDEVKVWSRTLSPEEINASFNAGVYRLERNFTSLPDAEYNFAAHVIDAAGNVNKTETRTVTVDTITPVINFTSPTDQTGYIFRDWTYVNVSVSDANNISAHIDFNRSLVGYWSFDYINATHVHDNSTYSQGGVFENFAANTTVAGIRGQALEFDGVDDLVEVSYTDHLNLTTAATAEAWVKFKQSALESTEDYITIVQSVISDSTPWNSIKMSESMDSDVEGITCKFSNVSGDAHHAKTHFMQSENITLNEWHHVACVYNGTHGTVYLDGDQGQVTDHVGALYPLPSDRYWRIGANSAANQWLNGSIDEVKVWNRALTYEEINASFNAGVYQLERNFTGLPEESFNFTAHVIDAAGNMNQTEQRTVTVDTISPSINFTYPTEDNGTNLSRDWAQVNITLSGSNIDSFIFNWNGTNATYFDNSLMLGMNFENLSAIGENSTLIQDISNYGGNATASGANWVTDGKYGGGYLFDGIDDYAALSNISFSAEATFAAWVKFNSTGTSQAIVGVCDDENSPCTGIDYPFITLRLNDVGTVGLGYGLTNWGTRRISVWTVADDLITAGEWYHIAGTVDMATNEAQVYVNGRSNSLVVDNAGSGTEEPLSADLYIGAINEKYGSSTMYDLNGTVDELRIWNRTLAADEIWMQYQSEFAKYASDEYRFYKIASNLSDGNYTYFGWANDTAGNENMTEIRELTVDAHFTFEVTLNSPIDDSTTSNGLPGFNFNVNGSATNYSCELFLDGVGFGVNSSVANDTNTVILANRSLNSSLTYDWNVNCTAGIVTNKSEETWQLTTESLLTAVFNPDTYSAGVGGYVAYDQPAAPWSTVRGNAGNANFVGPTTQVTFYKSTNWEVIRRTIFVFPSRLAYGADIQSATFSVYGHGTINSAGESPDLYLCDSNPASNTALVDSDYSTLGTTTYAEPVTWGDFNNSGYNYFGLNATGLAAISDVTKFGLRSSNDIFNIEPSISTFQGTYFQLYTAEQGDGYKPNLSITYTTGPVVYTENCTSLNKSGYTYYLTKDITDSTESYCMNISANDVIFDCQGYTIDGDSSATEGIRVWRDARESSNVTIKNCVLTDWDDTQIYIYRADETTVSNVSITSGDHEGIEVNNAYFLTFANLTLADNYHGLYLTWTDQVKVIDSNISKSRYYDVVYRSQDGYGGCAAEFINVNGTDNKPILFFNETVEIRDWDSNISELVLCGADNSVIDNLTMELTEDDANGVFGTVIRNLTLSNSNFTNTGSVVFFDAGHNSTLVNITANTGIRGVHLLTSMNNTVKNSTFDVDSYDYALFISYGSANNLIVNSSFSSTNGYAVRIFGSGSSIPFNNTIYNCLLNGSSDVVNFGGDIYKNTWNTTQHAGSRILGDGNQIGGNYYTNKTGNGFSDTCEDTNADGFCDLAYNVSTNTGCSGATCDVNNTDYLALSAKGPLEITGCTQLNQSGRKYLLTADILDETQDYCMNISANNVTLDCQGYMIDGNNIADVGINIRRDSPQETVNITIKNCNVTNWDVYAIYAGWSDYVTIQNTSISNNDNRAIELRNSDYANLTELTIMDNGEGFWAHWAGGVTISDSIILNNTLYDVHWKTAIWANDCDARLINVTGTDNKPILFFNETVEIKDWDNNVSSLILCEADNSLVENVTINHSTITGRGLIIAATNNARVYDSTFKNMYYGVHLTYSYYNNLTNVSISNSTYQGLYFVASDSNIILNSSISANDYGVLIWAASTNNTIANSSIISKSSYAIYIDDYADSSIPENNTFYNNLINGSSIPVNFGNVVRNNTWNVSQRDGDRRYSSGTQIGGNYYTNSTGNGFSDVCTDGNADGFCDDYYNVTTDTACSGSTCGNNVDYLALSSKYSGTNLTACGALDQADTEYFMMQNVSSSGDCFTTEAHNITLDCQGYKINYSYNSWGNAIDNTLGYDNITIKNCIIVQGGNSSYMYGYAVNIRNGTLGWLVQNNTITTIANQSPAIYAEYTNFSVFSDNTINTTGNNSDGIRFNVNVSNNNATNNVIYTKGHDSSGISVNAARNFYNLVSGNNITTNDDDSHGILIFGPASFTTMSHNVITTTSTWQMGIYFSSASSNTAYNNTIYNSGNGYGITFVGTSHNNTIANSTITSLNDNAIDMSTVAENNTIYNNLINGTNVAVDDSGTRNNWSISQRSETNIVGGPVIGGNFYANPAGTEFSETCVDVDNNGICDQYYNVSNNVPCSGSACNSENIDFLPLADYGKDVTPPQISFASPTPDNDSFFFQDWFVVNVSFTEVNNDTAVIIFDGANYTPSMGDGYFYYTFSSLSDGEHRFYGWMNDTSGNENLTNNRTVNTDVAVPILLSAWDDYEFVPIGGMVTFNSTWYDKDDTVKLLIANNSDFDACNYTVTTGCICSSVGETENSSSCTYTSQPTDGTIIWYAKVCDDQDICSVIDGEDTLNWNKSFNHYSTDEAYSVAVDADGNVYVAGIGYYLVSGSSGKDWWLKKFAANGTEDLDNWNLSFDGSGMSDSVNSVVVDADGNVYVAGGGYDLVSGSSGVDWWLKKFTANGNQNMDN